MAQRRGRTEPPCAGAARRRAATRAKPAAPCRRSLRLCPPQLVALDDASARMALAALEDLLIAHRARKAAADTTGES